MTFRYRHRKQIIICLVIILILGSTTSLYFFIPKKEKAEKGKMIITKNIQKASFLFARMNVS